jgi:hypothetical protein
MCGGGITVRLGSQKMMSVDGVETRMWCGKHSIVKKCWLINGDLEKSDCYRHHPVWHWKESAFAEKVELFAPYGSHSRRRLTSLTHQSYPVGHCTADFLVFTVRFQVHWKTVIYEGIRKYFNTQSCNQQTCHHGKFLVSIKCIIHYVSRISFLIHIFQYTLCEFLLPDYNRTWNHKLVDSNQLDALEFSNIFICLSLSTCFGHYVPIIRRDPIALTQLLYLSFRFSCVPCEHYSAISQPHSHRTRSAQQHARKPCLPHQQDIIPYVVKYLNLALLKMGISLPETCWADLGDQ